MGQEELREHLALANNLVFLERNYAKAAIIYEEIIPKGKGIWKDDEYWGRVSNLTDLYMEMAEYGKAHDLLQQQLKATGDLNETLKWMQELKLAAVLTKLGEFDRAEKIVLPMVTDPQKDPMGQSMIQGVLGDIYMATGRYKEAVKCYEGPLEALKNKFSGIDVESLGGFGVDRMFDLARAVQQLGDLQKARKLYEHVLGKSSAPNFRIGAADFYQTTNEFALAESHLSGALETLKKSFSIFHPDYADGLVKGALLYGAWGKPEKALENELLALESLNDFINRLSLWAGEERMQAYLGTVEQRYDLLYSLLSQKFTGETPEAVKALEKHLAYKGRQAEIIAGRNRIALLAQDPDVAKSVKNLREITQQFAHLSLSPPKDMTSDQYKEYMLKLEDKRRGIEEQIVLKAAQFNHQRNPSVGINDLLVSLPVDAIYLDFVEFAPYDYEKRAWTDDRRYLGFLVTRDSLGKPVARIENLGTVKDINRLIENLRQAIADSGQKMRGGDGAGAAITDAKVSACKLAQEALFTKLIAPFNSYLANARQLIISPSGNLYALPFELLRNSAGKGYLTDTYQIVYGLGRDVIAAKEELKQKSAKQVATGAVVIVASPDFKGDGGKTSQDVAYNKATPLARGAVRNWPITFDDLPGTQHEADVIAGLSRGAEISMLTGRKATEAAVKALHAPKLLHIATHGFFLEDIERPVQNNTRGIGGIRPIIGSVGNQNTTQMSNPSLRSGLALAGANRLANNIPIPEGEEDGILTASEVSGLDLHGTDLVVLSACETGLGELKRGEGVYGLRRAFHIAGAKNIIMSLWNVPDRETSWLMGSFYTHYTKGDTAAVALSKAKKEVREKLITRDGIDHPYYWAAFILEGTAPTQL